MKRKLWIFGLLFLLLLVLPIPRGPYKDGGTREYQALTYKIVDWNRLTTIGVYDKLRIYFPPHCYRSIDALWDREDVEETVSFLATVIALDDSLVTVEPFEDSNERRSSDQIVFTRSHLEQIPVCVGSKVRITYPGLIREVYPAQIDAISWELSGMWRDQNYEGTWLDPSQSEKYEAPSTLLGQITEIYKDCFFVSVAEPFPQSLKINAPLGEEWCLSDQAELVIEDAYRDRSTGKVEGNLVLMMPPFKGIYSENVEDIPCAKPVIYLYPQEKTEVSVELGLKGELTCTYPPYETGWKVTAYPDGTLIDAKGQQYNYLYWEADAYGDYDLSKGFCVKGEDTASFLEDALQKLGLTRREANEFIVYWLPLMEGNAYNVIQFQTEAYTEAAQLLVEPKPDSVIRVFMTWQAQDEYVVLEAQELSSPMRRGFTLVEWGGAQLHHSE